MYNQTRFFQHLELFVKKTTILASAVALSLSLTLASSAQASVSQTLINTVTSLVSPSQEVRGFARGGFSRGGGLFGGRSSSSSTKALPNRSSTSSNNAKTNTNNTKDADFNSNATSSRGNYGANFGGQGRAATGAAYQGGGSPFLSSMAGTMTGMMLYSMLFPSAAHASTNAPQVTPESISDEDLDKCLSELSVQKEKLQNLKTEKLGSGEATDEELAQIDADLQKLTDLELTLVKEQVRRLKEAS